MLIKFWKIFYLQQDEIHDTYNYTSNFTYTYMGIDTYNYMYIYTYNYMSV